MSKLFNIAASYGLADATAKAIYEVDGKLECFEDFIDHTNKEFIKQAALPQQNTLLHSFLCEYGLMLWENAVDVVPPSEMFDDFARLFHVTGITTPAWFHADKVDDNGDELWILVKQAARVEADAAFQLLFQDKEFLHRFHERVRDALLLPDTPKVDEYQESDRKIKRAGYLPRWLEKAIFFRDRGRCQKCFKDVSGTLHLENEYHLDHILPLNQWGTNDPTNFQLLCKECNLQKSDSVVVPTNKLPCFWE